MADTPQAPTEEQLTDVTQQADAAQAKYDPWQDDFSEEELTVKNKPEDVKETKDAVDTETDKSSEEADKTTEAKPKDEPVEALADPEPIVTVEDPGEYVPADYSFEVTLADGKTVTVQTPEQADEIGDNPDNFETPKQLMQFITKSNKMQRNLDRDHEKWEAQKTTFDEQTQLEADRQQNVETVANEIQYLVGEGLLPDVEDKYKEADWSDPEIAKQPGVKEQMALLDYMVKENTKRAKAGVRQLGSVLDAFNAMQNDPKTKQVQADKQAEADEQKANGEARKAAGSRVAGVSTGSIASAVPKGIAVGRVLPFRGAANWND